MNNTFVPPEEAHLHIYGFLSFFDVALAGFVALCIYRNSQHADSKHALIMLGAWMMFIVSEFVTTLQSLSSSHPDDNNPSMLTSQTLGLWALHIHACWVWVSMREDMKRDVYPWRAHLPMFAMAMVTMSASVIAGSLLLLHEDTWNWASTFQKSTLGINTIVTGVFLIHNLVWFVRHKETDSLWVPMIIIQWCAHGFLILLWSVLFLTWISTPNRFIDLTVLVFLRVVFPLLSFLILWATFMRDANRHYHLAPDPSHSSLPSTPQFTIENGHEREPLTTDREDSRSDPPPVSLPSLPFPSLKTLPPRDLRPMPVSSQSDQRRPSSSTMDDEE